MARWAEFESEAAPLAAFANERLQVGPAYLATIDRHGRPRVHPVSPIVGGGRLFVFMEPTSPKGRDLRERRSYAMHNGVPDAAGTGGEVVLRGDAVALDDATLRAVATEASPYAPADHYVLFELTVSEVVVTEYEGGSPRRSRWRETDHA